MRQALRIHPGSTCAAAAGIDVDVERPRAGLLRLGFEVSGAVDDLFLPEKTAPVRAGPTFFAKRAIAPVRKATI